MALSMQRPFQSADAVAEVVSVDATLLPLKRCLKNDVDADEAGAAETKNYMPPLKLLMQEQPIFTQRCEDDDENNDDNDNNDDYDGGDDDDEKVDIRMRDLNQPAKVEMDKEEMFRILAHKYAGSFSKKRTKGCYSEVEKKTIAAMVQEAQGNCTLVAHVCRSLGLYTIETSTVSRMKNGATRLIGRPLNQDFENAIVSRVLLKMSNATQFNDIKGTIAQTLPMMQQAAREIIHENPTFAECPIVRRLKFSQNWASKFFKRNKLLQVQ